MVNWNWGLRWGHLKRRGGGGRHSLVSISSFSSFGPSELPITWEWNAIYEFPGRRNQLQRINMSSKTSSSNKMTKFFISMGPHTFWCFFLGGGAWRQCRDGFCNCIPEANGRDGGEQSCLGFLGDNPWNPCYLLGGSTALHLCHELYYHCEGIEFWVRYGAIFREKKCIWTCWRSIFIWLQKKMRFEPPQKYRRPYDQGWLTVGFP